MLSPYFNNITYEDRYYGDPEPDMEMIELSYREDCQPYDSMTDDEITAALEG